ncbi:MAG: DUF6686 family protein [Bacteroidota bacterium]
MCEAKTLSRRGDIMISQCFQCKTINIWQHNVLLNFTPQQFCDFRKFISDLDFHERSHPFPDMQERAILKTPVDHINFVFTEEEWYDMREALDEALHMQKVFDMIG